MRAHEIATRAAALVKGDRANTHGDKLANHQAIAHVWNGYLNAAKKLPSPKLTALDVANLMECLKIARRLNGAHNVDDYIDAAGYAAVAGEIASVTSGCTIVSGGSGNMAETISNSCGRPFTA